MAASNSLNQSLYFLRRNIDPWYEDDVSVDYLVLQGDLLWLDPDVVTVSSTTFLEKAAEARSRTQIGDVLAVLDRYTGRFAPEFEYEEWAGSWRSRLHATYLAFANSAIDAMLTSGRYADVEQVATRVLAISPDASEIEQKLVIAYWRSGARSAARAHHNHLAEVDRADGLDPPSLRELVEDSSAR